MLEFLTNFFSSNGFMPHGHCYLWKPALVWLHIISDGAIALAYYSIPILLLYFISKRRDIPFNWVFVLFSAFIVACGSGHLIDIWTLWHPNYWFAGLLKAITAIISVYTALELVPLIPLLLALPSPAQLEAANQSLAAEIVERKRIEQDLRQAEAAATKANHAKSEFLANMSHELRTPLNGILGYAQILGKDRNLTDSHKNGLSIIYQCGDHLLNLINDILDLSKIEAQKMELNSTVFDFPDYLLGVTEVCRIRAEQKGIAFTYEPTPDLPVAVIGDQKRLRQVLINLMGNAIKFTEAGGVTFKVSRYESKIRFEVEDTGVGIAPEQLEAIFLAFQQVGDAKHRVEGTGLGLAISRSWIEMMGGAIKVKSTLGKGSTFWVDLELPEAATWSKPIKENEKTIVGFKGEKQKILVADDKWQNRSILVALLSPLGFEVIEASNGQDCLDKAMQFKPDLIITDLMMPVMDGFELTRQIRRSPELKHIAMIAASASVFESDLQHSLGVGCNTFIAKPIREEELIKQLQELLKLEWIYQEHTSEQSEEPQQEANASPIIPPSAKDLNILFDLAMQGDLKEIQEQATRLEQLTKELAPFAMHLRQLAQRFEEEQILDFIKQYSPAK